MRDAVTNVTYALMQKSYLISHIRNWYVWITSLDNVDFWRTQSIGLKQQYKWLKGSSVVCKRKVKLSRYRHYGAKGEMI
jgi:hypothetical protein